MSYAAAFASTNVALITAAYPRLGPINTAQDVLIPAPLVPDFATTLAAEQVSHLIEGWRFLSASLHAALTNSYSQTIHFAYYAELRSAMSLFAGAGLQIKNGKNFALRADGTKYRVSQEKTHDAVWNAWRAWAADPATLQLVSTNIFPFTGASLDGIYSQLAASTPGASLTTWGLDLAPGADHYARNKRSYNPFWKTEPFNQMTSPDRDFIKNAWRLLLPLAGNSLQFDLAFFRYWLLNALEELPDRSIQNKVSKYEAAVSYIQSASGSSALNVREMLKMSKPLSLVLNAAADPSSTWKNMIARAVAMLRIALLSVHRHLQSAGACPSLVKWTEHWLQHAGLWNPSSGIARSDLSADYEGAVEAFDGSPDLPAGIWTPGQCYGGALLSRPDACLIWAGPA